MVNGWKGTYRDRSHPQHSKHLTQEVLIQTLTHTPSGKKKYLTHFDKQGKLALTYFPADLTSKSAPSGSLPDQCEPAFTPELLGQL